MYSKYKKILLVPVFLVFLTGIIHAQYFFWGDVLKRENKRVNQRGSMSFLGTNIGETVQRIAVHSEADEKLQKFLQSLQQNKSESSKKRAHTCKTNHRLIKQAANKNPLFAGYGLTAFHLVDFCQLSPEEVRFLQRFFEGKETAKQAQKYDKVILLTLERNYVPFWFVVHPQNKMLTFNYNDPMDITSSDFFGTRYTPLSVK